MKIAMIGHKRIPSREGGVEIVVEELASRMVESSNDVTVYNRHSKGFRKIKEYKGIKIIYTSTVNKKSLDAFIYSFLSTAHAIFCNYDVIHYHALGPSVMLVIPHLLGIRTVATIHGLDWKRSKWGGFASWYLKLGEKIIAKYADEVIVLSRNMQRYIKETYQRDTHYICNGVNKPVIREPKDIKIKHNLEKDGYILFLARIVPEKGLHYLIEAFKQVKTDKKLVIAGGSSHTNDYLDKIIYMVKDDDRILRIGFVSGEELDSDVEGMPISLLESMSYNCPCLVSDIDENKEISEGYAITFKKGNIEDLKEKLEQIITYKIDRIKPNIMNKYNWDNTVKETLRIYKGKESLDYANQYSE